MTDWQPIDSAPKGQMLLLWGKIEGPSLTFMHPQGPIRAVGYWDEIDQAWALSDTPYHGPFIAPTLWQPLPEPPA